MDLSNIDLGTKTKFDVLDKQLNSMASLLADAYIARNGKPTVESMLKDTGNEYVPGEIYGAHIQALQLLVKEELELVGLSLVDEVNKTGETFEIGKLSSYEKKIITNKVLTLVSYTKIIKEKTEK